MLYPLIKAVISGILVASVSEVAKRNAAFGAMIASLPIVSILAMIWLWRDTGDAERIAAHAEATFWYVLPSLPMFLGGWATCFNFSCSKTRCCYANASTGTTACSCPTGSFRTFSKPHLASDKPDGKRIQGVRHYRANRSCISNAHCRHSI